MKPFLTFLFLLYYGWGFSQNFVYPTIKTEGQKTSDFVPKGWKILKIATGDLNKDNTEDFAFVLQRIDSVTILNLDKDTVLTQPRILLIAFANKDKLTIVQQSNTFILNHDNPMMEDPFADLSIKNNVLSLNFTSFANMGSWTMGNSIYKFRFQNQIFELIGVEQQSIHRASLEFENYSFNFLNKKYTIEKGNENENTKPKIKTKPLNIATLKNLQTFVQPYTWEIVEGVFL
jgi:hypothetical protein